jgi:hypothetical protein
LAGLAPQAAGIHQRLLHQRRLEAEVAIEASNTEQVTA